MDDRFTNLFKINLLHTLKLVGILVVCLIFIFILMSVGFNDSSIILASWELVFIFPLVLVGVAIYSKLKLLSLHKFLAAVIFSTIMATAFVCTYVIMLNLDGIYKDIPTYIRFFSVSLITLFIIYLQLPWKKDV